MVFGYCGKNIKVLRPPSILKRYFPQVNGVNVQGSSHEEVVKILTEASDTVSLVAYREKILNKKMKPMSQINGIDGGKMAADKSKKVGRAYIFIGLERLVSP